MPHRILHPIITAIVLNLVLVSVSSAATFYVRTGATGANNGSDWTNAWNNTSTINFSVLNPGDTVYIGAGTYGYLSVSKSGSAGNPITFKRATASEHGTSTGWSTSYDGRVIIDGGGGDAAIGIGTAPAFAARSYITIDGATKYGIWVRNAKYGVKAVYGSDYLTLRYLEIGDPGSYKLGEDGVQGHGNNLTIEYCYIHDNDNVTTHGDNIQWFQGDTITLRYNIFKNGGQMFKMGEEAWNMTVSNVNIYYNVFYNRGGSHYNGMVFAVGTPNAGKTISIYNNTFDLEATDNSGYNSLFYPLSGSGTVTFKNNAVIASNVSQVTRTVHSNNAYDNSGTYVVYNMPSETGIVAAADLGFTNVTNSDYRPAAGSALVGKGVNVGLTRDFDGKAVPSTPTIGAFEGNSGSAALPAPTNLRTM